MVPIIEIIPCGRQGSIFNSMAVDNLAMKGARAFIAMVLSIYLDILEYSSFSSRSVNFTDDSIILVYHNFIT